MIIVTLGGVTASVCLIISHGATRGNNTAYFVVAAAAVVVLVLLPFWAINHTVAAYSDRQATRDAVRSVADQADWETALIQSQEELSVILNTVPSAMIITDRTGTIRVFSASAERKFGYAASEAVGLNIRTLSPNPEDDDSSFIQRYLSGGTSRVTDGMRTLYARRRDGTLFPVELTMGHIDYGPSRLFTSFFRDITDRLALEERLGETRDELLRNSQLCVMGEMAAGLAHELNQPLAAASYFLGAADLVLAQDASRDQGRPLLKLGSEQVLRAGEIIRRMRGFVQTATAEMQIGSIRGPIEDAVGLAFLGESRHDVELAYDLDPAADMVLADGVQIGQVFFNLLRNAIEELRKGSSTARKVMIASKATADDMVEFSVADNGPGLDPSILLHPFKPFETNKPDSGMGIGLSICHRIITAHGGTIVAENNPGGGAIFRFTLRRSLPEMQEEHA